MYLRTPNKFKFLGFANLYRRFIHHYSGTARCLTELTKKELPFVWTSERQAALELLKAKFTETPILAHYDYDKPWRVETNASRPGHKRRHFPNGIHGFYWPVAYISTKMAPAECNYEIYDMELLAIIQAFEQWRFELEGSCEPAEVILDDKSLEYFMSTRSLSRRQPR